MQNLNVRRNIFGVVLLRPTEGLSRVGSRRVRTIKKSSARPKIIFCKAMRYKVRTYGQHNETNNSLSMEAFIIASTLTMFFGLVELHIGKQSRGDTRMLSIYSTSK